MSLGGRPPHISYAAILILLLSPALARAEPAPLQPWELLGEDAGDIFGWPNVGFLLSAVAVTPPLVLAVDEPVQRYFQRHNPLGSAVGTGAYVVGWTLPPAVPLALYVGGLATDSSELATAGAAALQAEVIQVVLVSSLKWLTDRKGPYPNGDPNAKRASFGRLRDSNDATDFNFNPFDIKGGLRWPSGHTASTVALVSCLVAFYPEQRWLALIGYPLAVAVGVGMIEGDYHWLSDVVAGALIGHGIGWVVGKRFRSAYDARKDPHTARGKEQDGLQWSVMPAAHGVRLVALF